MKLFRRIAAIAVICLFTTKSFSQFTATWAFTANNTGVKAGATANNVTINDASIGSTFTNNLGYSNNGVKCQPTTGNNWPTVPTDNWHIDFPISPNGSFDVELTGLTFAARTSGSSNDNVVSLALQQDGGAFVPFATSQNVNSGGASTVTFPAFSKKLFNGHTYVVRMYMYAATSNITASRSLTIKTLVFNGVTAAAGTEPSVTTNTVAATGKYTATATGSVTAGTYTINKSGVVWGLVVNPTVSLSTKTIDGPITSGLINAGNGGSISGLTAGTNYHVRAYVESETGSIFYGNNLTFTSNAPTVPSLTTAAITNITSVKATSGGTILDSGGVGISKKGVCWSTTSNPTILNNITNDGIGNSTYASFLKSLTPSTNYCVRAYAQNSIGVGYGNEICFVTKAPEPIITTTTLNGLNSIPFGDITINQTSAIKTYILTASALSPVSGNISINAPNGYEISLNLTNGFGSSITLPYSGGAISATTIYVRFKPTVFGAINGTITHAGGGATTANIDDVTLTGNGIQNPSELSNVGTDFWVGYGFQSLMTGNNNQEMVLYMSSSQDAVVTVEIGKPGDANYYVQTYNVSANNAISSLTIPKSGVQDARLNKSGVLVGKGIHVYTNGVPISLWAHIYAGSSSGATLVLPTNTWGSTYSVLTVGGKTNNGVPHSFFFVQAAEDSTEVEIVPSADITINANGTSADYLAGTLYTIKLNKGDVFNALGKLTASDVGVDLTGTTVVSKNCNKKIALFTGNGRVELRINGCTPQTGGSDNFIQQMFPKQAWGTKYVTSPFRDMEAGLYKIFVSDPTTIVRVNGNNASGLVQNAYTIETDTLLNIESDKPVMVAQFCATNKCSPTGFPNHQSTGQGGDPEMVILSPTQQAINDVTVYSSNNSNIRNNYINVIIPKSGVAGFLLDGVNVSSEFYQHTADTNYWYAAFSNLAGNTSHRLQSNTDFNAIAYGFSQSGSNESYGYCAGTYLKALNQFITVNNPYPNITNDSIIPTCLNNPFQYSVLLPYKPLSMHWDFYNNAIQLPNNDTVLVTNPIPVDSFNINGSLMYKYSLPTTYNFSAIGQFPVKITMNTTNADGCSGSQVITFTLKVAAPPTPYFTKLDTAAICGGNIITYTDSSYDKNGYSIVGREWSFPGLSPSSSTDFSPAFYGTTGTYICNIRSINSIGCYKDSSFTVTIFDGPQVDSILVNQSAYCVGKTVTFTARYTPTNLPIDKFYWDFGDGTKDSSSTNVISHTFSNANTSGFTITVYGKSNKGCIGNIKTLKLPIHLLKAGFKSTSPVCVNTTINFTDTSKGTTVTAPLNVSYAWSFGDPSNTPSTLQNPTFTYNAANTYDVWQKVSLKEGANTICEDSVKNSVIITPVLVLNSISLTNNNQFGCINKPITFTANSSSTLSNVKYYWSCSDGKKDTTTTNTLTRSFTTTGTYTMEVFTTVNGACISNVVDVSVFINNVKAIANFTSPQCVNTAVAFQDNSTGTLITSIYDTEWEWSFRDAANTVSTLQNPSPFVYSIPGSYNVKLKVKLLGGGKEACIDSVENVLIISPKLIAPNVTADASKTTTTSLTFNWNSILNATSYQVNVDGGTWTNPSSGTTGLQHVLSSLKPNTDYTVCVKPQGNCLGDSACTTAKTAIENQEVKIPNTFTPNGDRVNDNVVICSNTIQNVRASFYNQYGEKMSEVFVTAATSIGDCFEVWDGKAFGKPQPVGVYPYIATITLKNGKVEYRKGMVNLIR